MHPDIWRGQSALDRALELDEPRREALLADVRLDNPTMASMLEALLRDYERLVSDRLLDTSIEIEPPLELAPGQTVGAYTLEAPLGSLGWVPSGAPAAATAATKAGVEVVAEIVPNTQPSAFARATFQREAPADGSLTR